jgi:hypothetical protein
MNRAAPLRLQVVSPRARVRRRIVMSDLAEANILLSGLKATATTPSVCPLKVAV